MQTQIRLLLKEQSDQGLHSLLSASLGHITALLTQTDTFLEQLRKLFQVPQFLEFLPQIVIVVAAHAFPIFG